MNFSKRKIIYFILFILVSGCLYPQNFYILSKKADSCYQVSKYKHAIKLYQQALKVTEKKREVPLVFGKIGNVYEDISRYDSALYFYQKSLEVYRSLNDSIGIAEALNQTGNIYYRWGNMKQSLSFYKKSLGIQKIIGDKQGESSTLNNIGNIYYFWKNFEKALENYLKVLQIKKSLNDSVELANNFINIGSTYLGLKKYKQSAAYYQKALNLTKSNNNKNLTANCLLNMGVLSFEKGEYDSALTYYYQAYDSLKILDNKLGMATALRNLAETKIKTGHLDNAEAYLDQALVLAQEENIRSLISECYFFYYQIFEKKQDFSKALTYYVKYNALNDSLFNEQARQQLSLLQTQYETEKKEKEIQHKNLELAKKEKMIKVQWLWFLLIISVVLLSALFLIYFFRNRSQKKQQQLENEIITQRQKALSAQMNPHFISNALNSIQKYVLNNDFEKVNEFLSDFGALIRKVLENSRENYIALNDEVEYLRLYLSLESLRLDNKFSFKIDIADNIDPALTNIPPLIIQPYIENAIWHGIAPAEGTGQIHIQIFRKNHLLICTIKDDGIGINHSKKEKAQYGKKRQSLALKITKERLYLLSQSSKQKYNVNIMDISESDSAKHGTLVEIQMPFVSE